MWRTRYSTQVQTVDLGTKQRLAGWIEESRNLGKIAFLIVRDREGTFQVTLLKTKLPAALFDQAVGLNRESVIAVDGLLKANAQVRNGWELLPETLTVLSAAAAPLPLGVVDRVNIDLDTRLDARFMDLRRKEVQSIFKIRNTILAAGHEYLRGQGFLEINSTKLIGASSEGGTDVFKVKYFEREAFLSQSPQLYKQTMMATGLDRVYEVATYFRAEKHNTPRHLNEVTAFDLEMAFIENEEEVMTVIEGLMHALWDRVARENGKELEVLGKKVPVPRTPFKRISYETAVRQLQKKGVELPVKDPIGAKRGDPSAFEIKAPEERALGDLLQAEGHDFFFITKFPLNQKPFYCMPENGSMDDTYSRAFDLEYRGVELLSGAQRVHDAKLLEEGLRRVDLEPKDFEGYLKAFRYGMPPHGGCGIGIDRIVMQMLELPNIREAVLFPRDRTRISP